MTGEQKNGSGVSGIFVGIATLDVIQLVDEIPNSDEKKVCYNQCVAAGGPATNAAVVFSALGGDATLVTRIGYDQIGEIVYEDLREHGVRVVNVAESGEVETGISSILVTKSTGERAVVSPADFQRSQNSATPSNGVVVSQNGVRDRAWLGKKFNGLAFPRIGEVDVMLADSYELDLSLALLKEARKENVLTVLDCGVKKPYTEQQLPFIDVAAVAENYIEDGGVEDVVENLQNHNVPFGVITAGGKDLTYWRATHENVQKLKVNKVDVVDTLGAGDFFHGALAFALAKNGVSKSGFEDSLRFATQIAGLSVQHFGSRAWLQHLL